MSHEDIEAFVAQLVKERNQAVTNKDIHRTMADWYEGKAVEAKSALGWLHRFSNGAYGQPYGEQDVAPATDVAPPTGRGATTE
jgi:hypothetical protein